MRKCTTIHLIQYTNLYLSYNSKTDWSNITNRILFDVFLLMFQYLLRIFPQFSILYRHVEVGMISVWLWILSVIKVNIKVWKSRWFKPLNHFVCSKRPLFWKIILFTNQKISDFHSPNPNNEAMVAEVEPMSAEDAIFSSIFSKCFPKISLKCQNLFSVQKIDFKLNKLESMILKKISGVQNLHST